MSKAETFARELLKKADIEINGSRPWDIQVHNHELYQRVISGGSLAFGESYMDGWWDAEALDQFFMRVQRACLKEHVPKNFSIILFLLAAKLTNRQNTKRAFQVGKQHYDIGNELYEAMLDRCMQYSCGYWPDGVENLNQSQEAKLDLIARKLKLEPGMRVLDVGCGWGGLAKYLAEKHQVQVCGITISKEQAQLATERTKNNSVEIRLVDYRELQSKPFDRIASVGMFEHVGYKNYRTYMEHMHRLLKDDGIFLLHTIGYKISTYATDPWIDKYIFPNGMLPSVSQIGDAVEGLFVHEDWHNFGSHYDHTLMGWHKNFLNAWDLLSKSERYDERFKRMWTYYLLASAGSFRARSNQLWQIVLTKKGLLGGYISER